MSEMGEGAYQSGKSDQLRVVRAKHVRVGRVRLSQLWKQACQSCEIYSSMSVVSGSMSEFG